MVAAINFYHLTATPLDRALPRLLEKAYKAGLKTLVVAPNEERVAQLNGLLWTYDPDSFLPHGTEKDGHASDQPIFISTTNAAPNSASMLVITDGRQEQDLGQFERVLDIFDGHHLPALEAARTRWVHYKANGHPLTYFQQTETGGWQQKAQSA